MSKKIFNQFWHVAPAWLCDQCTVVPVFLAPSLFFCYGQWSKSKKNLSLAQALNQHWNCSTTIQPDKNGGPIMVS